MEWDADASCLVFLIADAPPHMDYAQDFDYRDESQVAAAAGIVVHAIGASGLDEDGERIFRDIAQVTRGEFRWLVYESRYTDQDGDEVVVRVEGREATYTKGDSTWTSEGGHVPTGGGVRGGAEVLVDADGGAPTSAEGGGGAVSDVSTTTNLDDLITGAIKEAAEADGVDYSGEATAVQTVSWAELKAQVPRR
jgi:hypothetical protein